MNRNRIIKIIVLTIFSLMIFCSCKAESEAAISASNENKETPVIESNNKNDANANGSNNNKIDSTSSSYIEAVAVSAGDDFSIILDKEGNVWASGNNDWGILGTGSEGNQDTFMKVKGLSKIVAISGGRLHSLALDVNGDVWGWGVNEKGQIGDGTYENTVVPVKVKGLADIVSIEAGGDTSLALKKDGTVWAWGDNMYGQLGSERDNEENPEQVQGLSNIIKISCAGSYCLAIDAEGFAWVWGDGIDLNLGVINGITTPQKVSENEEIKSVFGTIDKLTEIKGSYNGVIAIRNDNTLWKWGNTERAEQVADIKDAIRISKGGYHSLAIDKNGALWAWGNNKFGQLGNGAAKNENYKPEPVSGINNVVSVDGGVGFTIALCQDGTVWAWGDNRKGQLGIGSFESQLKPVKVLLPKSN